MKKERVEYLKSLMEQVKEIIDDYYLQPIEKYERDDMKQLYKEYPELKTISCMKMLGLQRWWNSKVLQAGWCQCAKPERLITFLEKEILDSQPALKVHLSALEVLGHSIEPFNSCRKLGEK